jgi:transposase-like protein
VGGGERAQSAVGQQRCTNHKTRNIVDKLPNAEQAEGTQRVRAVWQAETQKAAQTLADKLIGDWHKAGYDRAARCLAEDLDRCLTFHQFPEAHWSHLRTTNPIESIFASVRLRTNTAKRFKRTQSGVRLIYQVIVRLQSRWCRLKSAHLCSKVALPQPKARKKVSAA